MTRHPIAALIERADQAIVAEDFDTLMEIYSDDAVLVVKPGMNANGKVQIRKAFEAIAACFEHSLKVEEAGIHILEAGDTALVMACTVVSAANMAATKRSAAYVFKKTADGGWLCQVDNSYGHELLQSESA